MACYDEAAHISGVSFMDMTIIEFEWLRMTRREWWNVKSNIAG